MAVYTTFFLCKPEELLGGFPGWRLPLAQPVRRELRNPFTGEVSMVETREPEWPEQAEAELDRNYRVVNIEARYEDYLESRLLPFVRACPHWAAKGLTEVEVDPLLKAAGVAASLECAMYSPRSLGARRPATAADGSLQLRSGRRGGGCQAVGGCVVHARIHALGDRREALGRLDGE